MVPFLEMPSPDKSRFIQTPEILAKVDEALTRTGGNRRHVGDMLGLAQSDVDRCIRDNPGLRAKWGKPSEMPETDTLASELSRPSPSEALKKERESVVSALDKQDNLIAKVKGSLPGFSRKDTRFFGSIIAAYANDLRTTLDFSYAGSVHANAKLVMVLEQMCDRLTRIGTNPEEFRRYSVTKDGVENEIKGPNEYVKETVELIVKLSGELRKLSTSVAQAQELRLKVEKLRAATKGTVTVASWSPAIPIESSPAKEGEQ